MAQVATDQGAVFLDDPGDVAHYEAQFAQVDALALYGDDVRELLRRLADGYRTR
jgi:hypothetical protein